MVNITFYRSLQTYCTKCYGRTDVARIKVALPRTGQLDPLLDELGSRDFFKAARFKVSGNDELELIKSCDPSYVLLSGGADFAIFQAEFRVSNGLIVGCGRRSVSVLAVIGRSGLDLHPNPEEYVLASRLPRRYSLEIVRPCMVVINQVLSGLTNIPFLGEYDRTRLP